MKFFTVDSYNSWYDSFEDYSILKNASEEYWRFVESMQGILPTEVLALARLPGVDDGLIVRVKHDRDKRVLVLTLRCGDLQMGYYDLILTYEDAEISHGDECTLARLAHTTKYSRYKSDLYRHEVDMLDDGRIEHRLIFHPGIWFVVRCKTLRWDKLNRPNRELPRFLNRFPGGPPVVSSD